LLGWLCLETSWGGQSRGVLARMNEVFEVEAGFAVETLKRNFAAKLNLEPRLTTENKGKLRKERK